MKYHGLTLIVFLLSLIGCTRDKGVVDVDTPENIIGSWAETFDWEGYRPYGSIERTSTLTIGRSYFCVKILPPHRVLKISGDSVYVSFSEDTLYSGKYTIKNDTLKFDFDNEERIEVFKYSIRNDSLMLSTPAMPDTNGCYFLSTYSLLWAASEDKISGKFARIE